MDHLGSMHPDTVATVDARLNAPQLLTELVAAADVQFNGGRPWDIQVHDPEVYTRILRQGSLGFGEAYMDGQWSCRSIDTLASRLLSSDVDARLTGGARLRLLLASARHRLFNLQSRRRAFQVGEAHYDVGNDVFEAMLDPTMSYSCGYWMHADDLARAQRDKLDLVCRKLQLQRGERLLDIGCGWGGLARHAAEHYGVSVTGVTVSREQQQLARERCHGLPVTIRLQDYRDLEGRFDKIASVGMFEHVGPKNYPVYFDTATRLLDDDGLFLLHTIGLGTAATYTDPWIDRYIFPNGKLPSAMELSRALNGRLLIEDWHNFGQDYDRTLMAWWQRFDAAWPSLSAHYDLRFYRMWKYFLLTSAGFFRSRHGQLWQLVLSKPGRSEVYRSVR